MNYKPLGLRKSEISIFFSFQVKNCQKIIWSPRLLSLSSTYHIILCIISRKFGFLMVKPQINFTFPSLTPSFPSYLRPLLTSLLPLLLPLPLRLHLSPPISYLLPLSHSFTSSTFLSLSLSISLNHLSSALLPWLLTFGPSSLASLPRHVSHCHCSSHLPFVYSPLASLC